jgi:exosortase family protein XrtF
MKNPVIRFIVYAVSLYLIWFGLYEFILKPNGKLDHLLTENISIVTCYLLNLSDYNSYYTIGNKLGETYIFFEDQILPTVRIGASCNGLEMLMIFCIFVICYPGRVLNKILFLFAGVFIIHTLNIIRNYFLTILTITQSPYFELFHRYIFILLIYGVIFLLWMLWARVVSKLSFSNE